MKARLFWLFQILLLSIFEYEYAYADEQKYRLSRNSEEYNTRFLYCGDFDEYHKDTTVFLNAPLPKSFVIEVGAVREGERTAVLYDDNKELILANENGYLTLDGQRIGRKNRAYTKLSLYFVNGLLEVYMDDKKQKTRSFAIDTDRKIGLKISKKGGYICRMWNCYEPVPFKVADYGAALEDGILENTRGVRASPHNVGEEYNLTFPTNIANNSSRSIRFEYRYQDTKKEGASIMQRSRSEISGVFASSPKNKWIIEYDLYVPQRTRDDEDLTEIITQVHEGSSTPTSPAFCLFMRGGYLCCTTKGDMQRLDEWVGHRKPRHVDSKRIIYLQKERWYHIKIYLKEGWRSEDQPLARVWVDGKILYETTVPNCYNYTVKPGSYYDYLKFGVYNSGWLNESSVEEDKQTRVYYFDNYIVLR